MKLGVILVLNNNEEEIKKRKFINFFNEELHNIKVCFVNNGSEDDTLERLEMIKENANATISIIDIKRKKRDNAAIRVGARYLKNKENLQYVFYVKLDELDLFKNIDELVNAIKNKKLTTHNLILESRRTIFKNVFTIGKVNSAGV